MYKASVSKIKSFYNWQNQLYKTTKEDVIMQITGQKRDTYQKTMGTLFDAYIMKLLDSRQTEYDELIDIIKQPLTGYSRNSAEEYCASLRNTSAYVAVQVSLDKIYDTRHGEVKISMRNDILTPNAVRDVKVLGQPPKTGIYMEDVQGKFYSDAFEVDDMIFDCFTLRNSDITFHSSIPQGRTKTSELIPLIAKYIDFCIEHKLMRFL